MKLKRIFSLTCIIVVLSSLFIGCGKEESGVNGDLYLYNWGDYLDPALIDKFEAETGINVHEDVYDTNEIMYQKLKSGNVSYDLVIPSDYMIQKMISEGMLEKINFNEIPNYKYIGSKFRHLPFDPTGEYSVPYMWGTVGILYNKKMVSDPVNSWNILWNPKYKDNVIMVNSVRDSMMVALKKLGYSLNTTNQSEIDAAKNELIKQKQEGLVRAYMVDEVKDAMVANEAALSVVWSGDAVTMMERNPDLAFALPKEGSNEWFDGLVIPKGAKNKENAEKFINFLLVPENAAQNVEYIGYSTPNTGALELLDDSIKNNKVAYPNMDSLKNFEVFTDLDNITIKKYNKAWLELMVH